MPSLAVNSLSETQNERNLFNDSLKTDFELILEKINYGLPQEEWVTAFPFDDNIEIPEPLESPIGNPNIFTWKT